MTGTTMVAASMVDGGVGGGGSGGGGGPGAGGEPLAIADITIVGDNAFLVTPSGGTIPYSYQWTVLSGDAIAGSPTSSECGFTLSTPSNVRITVTDAASGSVSDTFSISP